MRKTGHDNPDACGPDGRLYQERIDNSDKAAFNIVWFSSWAKCLSNDSP